MNSRKKISKNNIKDTLRRMIVDDIFHTYIIHGSLRFFPMSIYKRFFLKVNTEPTDLNTILKVNKEFSIKFSTLCFVNEYIITNKYLSLILENFCSPNDNDQTIKWRWEFVYKNLRDNKHIFLLFVNSVLPRRATTNNNGDLILENKLSITINLPDYIHNIRKTHVSHDKKDYLKDARKHISHDILDTTGFINISVIETYIPRYFKYKNRIKMLEKFTPCTLIQTNTDYISQLKYRYKYIKNIKLSEIKHDHKELYDVLYTCYILNTDMEFNTDNNILLTTLLFDTISVQTFEEILPEFAQLITGSMREFMKYSVNL
jgi:hypothetical protein